MKGIESLLRNMRPFKHQMDLIYVSVARVSSQLIGHVQRETSERRKIFETRGREPANLVVASRLRAQPCNIRARIAIAASIEIYNRAANILAVI